MIYLIRNYNKIRLKYHCTDSCVVPCTTVVLYQKIFLMHRTNTLLMMVQYSIPDTELLYSTNDGTVQ